MKIGVLVFSLPLPKIPSFFIDCGQEQIGISIRDLILQKVCEMEMLTDNRRGSYPYHHPKYNRGLYRKLISIGPELIRTHWLTRKINT